MKFFAKDDALSCDDLGGIEITEREHLDAIAAKMSGREAYVYNGKLLIHSEKMRTVYDEASGAEKKIAENAPLPDGFVEVYIEPEKTDEQLALIAQGEMIGELSWAGVELAKHHEGHSRTVSTIQGLYDYKNQCRDYVRNIDGVLTIATDKPIRPE